MTNKQYQERLEDALFSQGANSMKDHTHVWRGMVSDRTREGCVECRIKRVKPISPTENTEELDAIIKKLMIDSAKDIHNREKHGAKADFRYAHEARAALMALIASSNHQAAQAFGEKVKPELEKALTSEQYRLVNATGWEVHGKSPKSVNRSLKIHRTKIVSVITSLMKGGVK